MTAFASLTLNADGNNVAVEPVVVDKDGVCLWMSQDSIFDARTRATLQTKIPNSTTPVARTKVRIVIPEIDAVTGKKVGEHYFSGEFVSPKNSLVETRSDLMSLASSFIQKDQVRNSVIHYQGTR